MPQAQKEKIECEFDNKRKICFVCTGNTCRSPMAAAAYNFLFSDSGITAYSRGISANGFSPISENAVYALKSKNIKPTDCFDYENHISRQISDKDFLLSEQIYGISEQHAMALIYAFPAYADKISPLPISIPDPFGGDEQTYCNCLDMIIEALKEISNGN